MSHDEKSRSAPRRFLIDVEETIRLVLEQEDTDGDFQISITDAGPKILSLGTATSNGFKTFDIRVRSIVIFPYLSADVRLV
jgi:alpha,alpha-trehalase